MELTHMLSIIDVPSEILALHEETKECAEEILSLLKNEPEDVHHQHGADLITAHPDSLIFIRKGICKNFYNESFVRFFSAGDLIVNLRPPVLSDRIQSEMAVDVTIVESTSLQAALEESSEVRSKLQWFCGAQEEILRALCATYAGQDFKPDIDLRQYEKGDIIINEGDNPEAIFEMIEGCALVTVKGTEVGRIERGEVFGEISFLTASPRTASVVAAGSCLCQAIKGGDFDSIVKFRPTLIHSMSRTIAKRLTEVNERLVRISGLT